MTEAKPQDDGSRAQNGLQYLRDSAASSYQDLLAVAKRETNQLRIVPGGPLLVYGVAALAAAAFAIAGLGISAVYTESLLFLVTATAVGLVSRTSGLIFWATYALLNLARVSSELDGGMFLGRLISYVLLAILAVGIPNLQRRVFAVLAVSRYAWLRVAGAAAASSLVAAALVYLWTVVTPYLIRPVFHGSPTVEAVETLQQRGWILAALVFALSLAIALTFQRLVGIPLVRSRPARRGRPPGSFELWRRLILYTLAVTAMRGLVTGAVDVVLLLGALVGGDVLASVLFNDPRIRGAMLRVPYIYRFGAAFGLTFLAAYGVLNSYYESAFGSEFFPLVLSLAIGFLIFHVLLGADERPMLPGISRGLVRVFWIGAGVATMHLGSPLLASADNCSGLSDCAVSRAVCCTAAGLASIVAAIWAFIKSVGEAFWDWIDGFMGPDPVPWSADPLSPEAVDAQRGWVQALKKKKADEALANGDVEEWRRIRNMSDKDFIREFAPDAAAPQE